MLASNDPPSTVISWLSQHPHTGKLTVRRQIEWDICGRMSTDGDLKWQLNFPLFLRNNSFNTLKKSFHLNGMHKTDRVRYSRGRSKGLRDSWQEFLPSIRNKRLDGNIWRVYDFVWHNIVGLDEFNHRLRRYQIIHRDKRHNRTVSLFSSERSPDKDYSCEYNEQVVADNRQGVR